jgi:hypothetical protein
MATGAALCVLSDEIQQQWQEAVESLDPLRLVQHVEALQRAVWRCAEGGPGMLVRFSRSACASAAARPPQRASSDMLVQGTSHPIETRDWSRSMDDPFPGECIVYSTSKSMVYFNEEVKRYVTLYANSFCRIPSILNTSRCASGQGYLTILDSSRFSR